MSWTPKEFDVAARLLVAALGSGREEGTIRSDCVSYEANKQTVNVYLLGKIGNVRRS